MNLKSTTVSVDGQALSPTLVVQAELEFAYKLVVPISISGRLLSTDERVLAYLNECQINYENRFDLAVLSGEDRAKHQRERASIYSASLTACLSPVAIEHLERQRDLDGEKAVRLNVEYVVKYIDVKAEKVIGVGDNILGFHVKQSRNRVTISQSDWINKYANYLGVGNVLLLELQLPNDLKVNAFWKELYDILAQNVKEMENCLRSGDWFKTMICARRFYENAKIGDGKEIHNEFKNEFMKLMIKDQHNEEGCDNLLKGIWQFFEFISKYSHEKDKKGNIKPIPIAKKEDAYFAYTASVGLLNLLGSKLNDD